MLSFNHTFVDMNTGLRKKRGKMTNNAFFEKTLENGKKHRDYKCHSRNKKNYLVSDPIYHATKIFTENFVGNTIENYLNAYEYTCRLFRTFNARIK